MLLQISPSGSEFDLLTFSQDGQNLLQPGYPFEPPVAEEFRIIGGDDDAELRGVVMVFAEFLGCQMGEVVGVFFCLIEAVVGVVELLLA